MYITIGRTIRFWDDINSATVKTVVAEIQAYSERKPKEWISLELHSAGGEFFSGLALCDWLSVRNVPLQIIGLGRVDSMAVAVFAMGQYRVAGPNCSFFLHQPGATYEAKTRLDIDRLHGETERLELIQKQYVQILLRRMTNPPTEEELIKIMADEKRLSAEQALEIGLVNEVIK